MNKEALIRLADKLEGVGEYNKPIEPKEFDLGVWVSHRGFNDEGIPGLDCGTVACAVGYAIHDPWFIERGLQNVDGSPSFKGINSWTAVQLFFDLDYDQAVHLFDAEAYDETYSTEPCQVAERIREFIANA